MTRELTARTLAQWLDDSDVPSDVLFVRSDALDAHLSAPTSQPTLPIEIYGKIYDVPIPVQVHIVSLGMQLDEAKASQPDDGVLRSSVPDRWKTCTSAVGGAQAYIAELEQALVARGVDLDGDAYDLGVHPTSQPDRKALAEACKRLADDWALEAGDAALGGDEGLPFTSEVKNALHAAIDRLAAAHPVQEPAVDAVALPELPKPYMTTPIPLGFGGHHARPLYTGFQMQDYARAALAATPAAPAVPSGWQLVPIEPTGKMHAAAVKTIIHCNGNAEFPPRVWKAMLAAAPSAQPTPTTQKEGE